MKYRFSGHETFVCRYTWLPKAVQPFRRIPGFFPMKTRPWSLSESAKTWSAPFVLGWGLRCHRECFQPRRERFQLHRQCFRQTLSVTSFGRAILGEKGFDPYLEDDQTLWFFHWKLSSRIDEPLFAWDFLLNRFHEPEITKSVSINCNASANLTDYDLSRTTIEDHLDIFFRPTTQPG